MTLFHIVILALIQGLTEFIPVSSSAHLILPSKLFENWPDQGLDFDIAVHLGTLLAVIIFYRKDIYFIVSSFCKSVFKGRMPTDEYGLMALYIVIATIPVGIAGILLKDYIEAYTRNGIIIASTTIFFGLLLYFAELFNKRYSKDSLAKLQTIKTENQPKTDIQKAYKPLSLKAAIGIGFAQMLAIIPGTSRSGITLTAGYFFGLFPKSAAKFSFLLSIPTIGASALLAAKDIVETPGSMSISLIITAMVISFITAYIVIKVFLELLTRLGLLPYVIYRLLLGAFLLYVFW